MASRVIAFSLLFGAVRAETAGSIVAFVGTGGCDGEDKACVISPSGPERAIHSLVVASNGSLQYGKEKIVTGSNPVWLTTLGRDLKSGCLFATLANTSEIFAYGSGAKFSVPSGGVNPVFAAVTEDQKTLIVANYHGPDNANTSTGASVASFRIGSKCSLTLADRKDHSGSSVNPERQGGAHVHSAVPVRGGLVYVCDLGTDEIYTYTVGADNKLTEKARTKVQSGFGPRHLVPHPFKPFVYVVNEMGRAVTVFEEHPTGDGPLKLLQTLSVVHKELGNGDGSKAAEIAISPDGKFVFATNRGSQNTVTVFETLPDGKLSLRSYAKAPSFPRGMALVQEGKELLVAGQTKTEVWSYKVGADGSLTVASELESDGISLPPHPATFTTFQRYSPEVLV
jgi:6-phosphogluconolactonase